MTDTTDRGTAWLSAHIDIEAEPEAVWNEGGGFAVVRLTRDLTSIHVMSREQARVLKEAFAAVEAMYAEREAGG